MLSTATPKSAPLTVKLEEPAVALCTGDIDFTIVPPTPYDTA
jgi:hypothetical protein